MAKGHNEGTIRKRPDGRWEARVSLPDGGRKSIYGKTRDAVKRRMVSALDDVQKGQPLPNDKVTVQGFLDEWLEGTAKARLRTSTYLRYSTLIRLHVGPQVGRVAIGRLTAQQVQALWTKLQSDGLSPRTIIQVRAILRTALKQAVKHGLANRNAAALSDAPKAPAYKPVFLNAEQAESLLQAAKGHNLEALVTLALTSGLRAGEMLGLTWSDIDLEGRSLKVSRQQQRVGKELVICDPKTDRSARKIALTEIAVVALKAHKAAQLELLRAEIEAGRVVSGRVFTNETGGPVENSTVLRQFQRLVKDAKLPRMRLHDLRHSCATLLLSRGVHPRVAMELLGHSTIAMTMNVYSHVVPEIARDAANAMDAVFAPKQASGGGSA